MARSAVFRVNAKPRNVENHSLTEAQRRALKDTPRVSVIVPMRNEAKYIGACLQSIIDNTWSGDDVEIIVVDGESEDTSPAIVAAMAQQHRQIRSLTNRQRTAPHAMNIGIHAARGQYVLRMDAHAIYDREYIERSIGTLEDNAHHGVVGVGGVAQPVGAGLRASAIALAVRSAFGAGDAHYRFARDARFVDTIWNGCWTRDTLIDAGGFNEQWLRNQDYELNYRLRQSGGRLMLNPQIRCHHYMRDSLQRLARQYFEFGTWRVRTLVTHPGSLRWRQLVAPLFVVAIVACLLLSITLSSLPLILLGAGYGAAALSAAIVSYRRHHTKIAMTGSTHCAPAPGWQLIPTTALAFAIIHLAWGIGFFNGIGRFGIPRIKMTDWRQLGGLG